MSELDDLAGVLPRATAEAWPHVAAVAPSSGVLHGGTALAVHLRHRVSRDLDVFMFDEFDPETVAVDLRERGRFSVDLIDQGTLNGIFDGAKVQFLSVQKQRQLEAPTVLAGLRIASISDLYATKINAVAGRGELRDYFDLMRIEQDTGRRAEEGLSLFMERFGVDRSNAVLGHAVNALGYLEDLQDDPYLSEEFGPEITEQIKSYWRKRHPEVVRSFDASPVADQRPTRSLLQRLTTRERPAKPINATGSALNERHTVPRPPPSAAPRGSPTGRVWVPPHTRNGRRVEGYWRDR